MLFLKNNFLLTGEQVMPIGHGLEKHTAVKYKKEWNLYLKFVSGAGITKVPGRDEKWNIKVVKRYLEWRSKSNNVRSLAQIKSMLKHCGLCFNHLLPTAKSDGQPRLRLQLGMVTRDVGKKAKKKLARIGKSTAPKRSLALGKVAVSLLFSAYKAESEKAFARLKQDVRHHLVTCACMHTGGMRFELVRQMRKTGEFRWSEPDQCWRLASDWHKMRRRVDTYTVDFPLFPQFAAMTYEIYADDGSVRQTFTAATVLQWHMKAEGKKTARYLFAPTDASSANFQQWLQASFQALLAEDEKEVAVLVKAITPHSFRAGMAGDLEREDVPRARIKKMGRWDSDRAMEQYIRGGLAQRLQRIAFHRINCFQRKIKNNRGKARVVRVQYSDSSEGYDSSDEADSKLRGCEFTNDAKRELKMKKIRKRRR